MPKITVDLNKARIKAAEYFNDIVTSLNKNTENDGYIRIHTEELQVEIERLRSYLSIICHTYINRSSVYDNISEDVPEFVDFNPKNY